MWFGQTGLNVKRFETGLSASVNGAMDSIVTHQSTRILRKGWSRNAFFRKCARSQRNSTQSTVKARKSVWSTVKTSKRAGQSFDLAVAAVTIESMGVTPPCHGSLENRPSGEREMPPDGYSRIREANCTSSCDYQLYEQV